MGRLRSIASPDYYGGACFGARMLYRIFAEVQRLDAALVERASLEEGPIIAPVCPNQGEQPRYHYVSGPTSVRFCGLTRASSPLLLSRISRSLFTCDGPGLHILLRRMWG